ncbi:DUF1501 domain-containing protein [Stieleria varia]|uniref:DUF1501 domain-containing protein n=1 Tax=Stieleria varia TaxID=2528005 RepID=A0A5C6B419_9BACT|nr:DUF1501 domain-containing protein [Stieleria varia]TWU06302.1 hypothetical protein Pla52n_20230 [Stieleria varia]
MSDASIRDSIHHRRDLLRLFGAAGIGLTATACADDESESEPPYDGPFYVVVNASGGWDTTYLMDPKGVGGINRLYDNGDILTEGEIKFAPTSKHITEGMSNEDFFARYAKELLVLNGLDYSVNNHSPCSRYMATGHLDSAAYPTFAALVAACRGPECPLSFLTFGNYSATANLVPMARVPYIQSLKLLANADSVHGATQHPYHDDFASDRIEQTLAKQNQRSATRSSLPRQKRAESMLYAAQWNSQSLSRITPHIPKSVPKDPLSQQAEIALASFKAGVCVSANLTVGQFDSHQKNDEDQMKLLPRLLASIDYLLRRAEELQIREKLVLVMQSEMGRTPNYNNGDGKDHWSIGSIMFLGPGIRGNRVIGATDDAQMPHPFDPQSLSLNPENGIRVRPEHIHIALRELAGVADHPFAERFPFKVAETEKLADLWGIGET